MAIELKTTKFGIPSLLWTFFGGFTNVLFYIHFFNVDLDVPKVSDEDYGNES